ncbi:LmbU family transcriptional regulator [Mycobacterium sp. MUNTM1]
MGHLTTNEAEDVTRVSAGVPRGDSGVMVTRVGLRLPENLPFDSWTRAGTRLAEVIDSSSWCLGDWLIYGKRYFPDRYERAIGTAGLRYQTLRNYAWIARRFPQDRRRGALTFQHHAEVASLPDDAQECLLNEAELGKWTTKQLRRRVRDLLGQIRDDANDSPRTAIPLIAVEDSRLAGWHKAAQHVGIELEHWIVRTLDVAAQQVAQLGTQVVEYRVVGT